MGRLRPEIISFNCWEMSGKGFTPYLDKEILGMLDGLGGGGLVPMFVKYGGLWTGRCALADCWALYLSNAAATDGSAARLGPKACLGPNLCGDGIRGETAGDWEAVGDE